MDVADRLDVRAIDHVGVAVGDLDAALALWTGLLGGQVTHRETNDDQQIEEAMVTFEATGTQLQVVAATSPDSAIAGFLDRRGPGLQHVALQVPDVAAAAATLRTAGLRVLYDQARRGTSGSAINFVHPQDAGGVLVELVQPAQDPGVAAVSGR